MTGALLKGEPGHVDALLLRSRAYIHLADLDLAKRHLGEVLSRYLTMPWAHSRLIHPHSTAHI